MKLKIQHECQIGAHAYKIRISNKALDVADLRGKISYNEQLIRLSTALDGNPRSASMIFEALIHEMIHPISHLYCNGEITEQQTEALAAGLAQSLMSLGIEPDFGDIPEEEL